MFHIKPKVKNAKAKQADILFLPVESKKAYSGNYTQSTNHHSTTNGQGYILIISLEA